MDPRTIIEQLGMEPHPEGGWFRSTWRAPAAGDARPTGSAIYYLLTEGDDSRPHRVDATELWHFYAGAVVDLAVTDHEGVERHHLVGPEVTAGQRPQVVVPPGTWQRARTLGAYTLLGCTVSPAFEWSSFELR